MVTEILIRTKRSASVGLLWSLALLGLGIAFTEPVVAQSQTAWRHLEGIDSYTTPAVSGHSDGRVYVAAIAFNGLVASISTDAPGGWDQDGWKIIGPPPSPPFDQAFYANANTPPVFARDRDANTLYLFVRGKDDNLYETHKSGNGDWSEWQQLTSTGSLRGRISVALTRRRGSGLDVLDFHVVYTSANNTVEYRRFSSNGAQLGPTESRINALEATIGTDGANEVLVVIRTNDGRLLIERKYRQGSQWPLLQSAGEIVTQGEFFDISNVVYFAGSYHVAYSVKHPNPDEFGSPFLYSLDHARIRPAEPNGYTVQTIADYRPQGDNHPQAELGLYRNKLVAAYKDQVGWIRYAYWDNADPLTPWIGRDIVAGGSSTDRPALGTFNKRTSLSGADYLQANFGDDLFSVVTDFGNNGRLWFINFSRAFFAQRIDQIGLAVIWCKDYQGSFSDCQDVGTLPAVTEAPVFTEVGFGTITLPDRLMSRVFLRTMASIGQPNTRYNTWIHTQPIRPYIGPNLNIDYLSNYIRWWEEMGHRLAGSLGIYDQDQNPTPNLMSDFIPDSAINDALDIFGQRINPVCSNNKPNDTCPETRVTGFTGAGNNYDVGTRQHSWIYVLYYHMSDGDFLRRIVREDLDKGDNLLQRKYDWIRQYLFQGLEFKKDNQPLITHAIVAQHSGKCLEVWGSSRNNGANVQQYACHGGSNQKWELRLTDDGSYQIIAKHSGKCLEVWGSSSDNGANVQQYACHGGSNQKWELRLTDDGYYQIVAQHSGKCLDVAGSSGTNGANVQQYACHGGDNQKWRIE